jgi:hypothetical protein
MISLFKNASSDLQKRDLLQQIFENVKEIKLKALVEFGMTESPVTFKRAQVEILDMKDKIPEGWSLMTTQ